MSIAILQPFMETGGKLFPLSPNALRLSCKRILRKVGIAELHFHDLRHEAISRFFEKGLTIPEASLVSGHKDVKMLFRYSHALLESTLKKLEDHR